MVTNTSAGRDLVTTVASAKGISQFTALAIGAVGKHYTIRFTSSLLLGAESHLPMSVAVGIPVRPCFRASTVGILGRYTLSLSANHQARGLWRQSHFRSFWPRDG